MTKDAGTDDTAAQPVPIGRDKPSPEKVGAFLDSLERGLPIGGRDWTRDELYAGRC